MKLILKGAGIHVDIDNAAVSTLLSIKALCSLLEVDYSNVRKRMSRTGETVEQSIAHYLSKGA
ncbi:hypothetical protein ACM26M_02790 [Kluyvera cryocrescens]|uniref:hypothetical protein n=1 Tax=Kluyvera cryocrescens TaxID=580 RepID=UPI0039F6B002